MTSRMPHKSSFGNTGSPYNMFFLSLFLHLIVFAAVIITVPTTSRQLTFGAPYSVSLVGPEVMHSPHQDAGQKTISQDSPPAPAPPVILKREPVALKAVPLVKKSESTPLTKKKDTSKRDIEKAINAIRQKELSKGGAKNTGKSLAAGSPYGTATNSSQENQSQINDYYRFVWLKIKKNWTLPAALMPKNNVETIIEVRIARSGALEYIDFEKRSGNTGFDEAALRAVKKSAPFPPLTDWMPNHSIEIGIRFHSAEFR